MTKGIQPINFKLHKINTNNNPFAKKENTSPINTIPVSFTDSVQLSTNPFQKSFTEKTKMFFTGQIDKSMESFNNYKNFFSKKYNQSVDYAKSISFGISEKSQSIWNIISETFTKFTAPKAYRIEKLSQKPVNELEEMLLASLTNH